MKRLLTTLVILTGLFAPSLAVAEEGVKYGDLVERGGIFYKKFTDEPFTGKTTGQEQSTFRRGKKHGLSVSYHENGQLRWKGTYKDGKEEGPSVSYHENGQLRWKGTYENGKEEGPWVSYHANGQLWWKGTWKDGMREGPWVFYYKGGTKDTKGKGSKKHEGTGTYRKGKKVSD
jgi:antitoxin component YwqK of YwqJK toxin-antitoxin module